MTTDDLIQLARDHTADECEDTELITLLADALESALSARASTDDERVARLMSHVTPLGYASALALVEAETRMLAEANEAARRSEVPDPTHLVASLPPATKTHEPDDARNGKEDHRGDREPKVPVRSTGDHQNSAEADRDDRDCETDPPEHRLQAAYPHRSTLADGRSAVERVDLGAEAQGEPSDPPQRLVHEVNMLLSSVASHGPAALTDTSDRMYTPGLLRRLRDALDPKPAQRLAAGNAVRAEMARSGLDVHRMVYGQEIANVLAGAALDAALRAAGGVR